MFVFIASNLMTTFRGKKRMAMNFRGEYDVTYLWRVKGYKPLSNCI